MAHFIGGVEGNRGPASRLGTPKSGIHVYAQGWNIGVSASCRYHNDTGRDVASARINSGSNGGGSDTWVFVAEKNAQGTIEVTFNKDLAKNRNIVIRNEIPEN